MTRWALVLGNTVDGLLTYGSVTSGLAVEANPLMAALLAASPAGFLVFKLCVVNGLALSVADVRPWVSSCLSVLAGAYVAVVAYHLYCLAGVA